MEKTNLNFPDFDDFLRYHQGAMPPDEQHQFEMRMLEEPLLADAYDGFLAWYNEDTRIPALSSDLRERLTDRISAGKRSTVSWWAYGAAASVLIAAGLYGFYFLNAPNEMSEHAAIRPETKQAPVPAPSGAPQKADAAAVTPAEATKSPVAGSKVTTPGPSVASIDLGQNPERENALTDSASGAAGFTQAQPAGVSATTAPPAAAAPGAPLPTKAFAKSLSDRAKTEVPSSMRFVSGRVVDAAGSALPGVQVRSKSNYAEITDSAGRFRVPVNVHDSLRLSFIGFNEMKIPVSGQEIGTIRLEEFTPTLDEVVVTHAETQRKKSASVSAAVINAPQPVPADGWKAYQEYLDRRSKSAKREGKVVVSFAVNANGSLSGFLAHGAGELRQDAVRIVREGPLWKPAVRDGSPVSAVTEVQIWFRKP
nr:carboxypeptidase-like regulatory domain-containing protein [uncultured Dyadobacter sp.]